MRNSEAAGYSASTAEMDSPKLAITSGWIAGPNAISDYSINFIEAGPFKDCSKGCKNYPYSSSQDVNGVYQINVDHSVAFLDPTTFHMFGNRYKGNQVWEGYWCYSGGCRPLQTRNLGQGKGFPYVISGAEGSSPYGAIGNIISKNNQFTMAGTSNIFLWCYTQKQINVQGGGITSCGSNKNWSIYYNK